MRIAGAWGLIHMAYGGVILLLGGPLGDAFLLALVQMLWLWAFVVLAVLLDLHRRQERIILGNLGFSRTWVAGMALVECVALEVGLQLVGRVP